MLESYIKRLQTNLGDDYYVCQEEKIDYNTGKDIVLVKNTNSTNHKSCIEFGLQLEIYTNNIPESIKKFSVWSWEEYETIFSLDGFGYVRQWTQQPVNNSNFIQVHENYIGTLVIGVTLLAGFNLIDIKEVYVDNEFFDPNQIVFSYNATTDNQRNNAEELNSTLINESNLQCQVVFPSDNLNFNKKVRSIIFGMLSKNTDFNIKIVWTDGVEIETTYKMSSASINKQRGVLTTDSITLIH